MTPLEYVSLADHCTMGVGGPARYFVEAREEAAVLAAHGGARARQGPLRGLGGGSDLVGAGAGGDGLVGENALRGGHTRPGGGAGGGTAGGRAPRGPPAPR